MKARKHARNVLRRQKFQIRKFNYRGDFISTISGAFSQYHDMNNTQQQQLV